MFREIAERTQSVDKIHEAILAHRLSLSFISKSESPEQWAGIQNNLGYALQNLGEMERDEASLHNAVAALEAALSIRTKVKTPEGWASSKNNLGLTCRWLGAIASNLDQFDQAAKHYDDCLTMRTKTGHPFNWAKVQWNIADLAVARFAFDPDPALLNDSKRHVLDAREVFSEGSDYQTERCDDLLAQIEAARAVA